MNIGFRLRCSAVLAVVTIALAALAPLRPAYGMEFSITTTSPLSGTERKLNYVLLKGEIVPGDYAALLAKIAEIDIGKIESCPQMRRSIANIQIDLPVDVLGGAASIG